MWASVRVMGYRVGVSRAAGARGCGRTWLRVPRVGAAIAAGLLGVPVGGGPPARRPRRELRSARRLEARPGPAAAHGHCSQALLVRLHEWLPNNVARNSLLTISTFEFMSLELQRFQGLSKTDRGKLRATFVW